MMSKPNLRSLTIEELSQVLAQMGQPKFRAKQLFTWLAKGASFEQMSNIPAALKDKLAEQFRLTRPEVERRQDASDGTVKFLWKLHDGEYIESVLMRYEYGCTVCVSSQVGCAMGCAFCASTKGGLVRDLDAGEILEQVIFTGLEAGVPISHIVLMGIGEPLANYDNVMRFLDLVNHPDGVCIGMRKISLSTCGLVDRIDKLAERNVQLTLSVSLHSAVTEVREKLMPVAKRWDLKSLYDACRRYYEKTGRRISYEYSMIDGVNDTDEAAAALSKWVKAAGGGHVNLIRLNRVEESPLEPTTPKRLKEFVARLEKDGVTVTVRRRLGTDIDAACGQLRRKSAKAK